ncbi:MAG: TonB-dependent receptor plug domain-containing protein [Deltaproteobacteria bacterium]|jgi:iron complex outermembrane receptor protein|nr:TonB-dependent receptor plug domain-containing protein [Deltaproteobacteria bacterium]
MRAPEPPLRASAAVRRWASVALRACFTATLLFGFASFAQDETPPKTTPADETELQPEDDADSGEDFAPEIFDPSAGPSFDIEEIVITGEQGGMMVKDDTVSVMSFDAGDLPIEGISDIRDLSNFTPSLEIKSAFAASNPTIYIRGVGLDDFNANAASAVAVYQDGVYMQSPAGQLFQFYDVENVEVLRGPQGALYRAASAGAILLRSRKPEDEFSSSITATYGNYELWEIEGSLNIPIIPDILSSRFSGTWSIRDGITKNRCAAQAAQSEILPPPPGRPVKPPCNQTTGGAPGVPQVRFVDPNLKDKTNDIDNWASRGQLLLNAPIGDTETEWLLNIHGGQNRSRAFQYQHTGVNILRGSEEPSNIGGPDEDGYRDADGDPFRGDYNIDGPENIDLFGANLQTIWLFGGSQDYELRNLVAYEWHDLYRLENSDGSPYFSVETTYTDTSWQFSEQLELRGSTRASQYGDGDWRLGVDYLQEDLDVSNFFDQVGDLDLFQQYTQEMWYFAVYGQFEYRFQPGCARISCDFTVLAGMRYNWEHKSFDTDVVGFATAGQELSALSGEEDKLRRDWSGDFSLAWNYSDDSNLYIKYSKGWKGGHFNGGAVSVFDIITGVEPEIVDSYEVGLRSSWFDNRLRLNLTSFYYDYLNLQVFIIEQTPLGYPIPKLANAEDATVYGVELDLETEPIDGLFIKFNAAWVESEYNDFIVSFTDIIRFPRQRGQPPPDPPTIAVPRKFDYSGNTLIASPTWSATGSIEYDIPVPGEIAGRGLGTLTPRFSFTWKDEMLYDACGGRGNRCNFDKGFFGQDNFWVFNAALTWTSENEMLTLTGWVHNFMDEHYKTQSFDFSRGLGILLDAYAEPRTYGITATLSF